MKRSGPPKRRRRLRSNPGTTRAWQDRSRRRLPAESPTGTAKRARMDDARAALIARSGGFCEVRGSGWCRPGIHEGRDPHHCWPSDRDRGKDDPLLHDPNRMLWICREAHEAFHGATGEDLARVRAAGFLLRSTDDPSS